MNNKAVPRLTLNIRIRSLILWFIMVILFLPLLNLVVFLLLSVNLKLRHQVAILWPKVFTLLTKYLCGVNYTVRGKENLIYPGPAIIVSNHQSLWETMAFSAIFPQHIWILKKELLSIPLFGWTLRGASPIAINRAKSSLALKHILKQGIKRIKHGFWIILFPEGTRVAPNNHAPFKIGFAQMAHALNIPIIPVAHNAWYVMPKNSFWIYPGKVEIIIDQVIYPQDIELEALVTQVEHVVRTNMKNIADYA